ncbi:MAG: DNA repair protein RecO [Bacteroidetes bacterium HGW-Bacteroidetes-8]|jgi:DNA repair protein RecO (recombination protein O)|nr:MAG: DNA repair protein RecO [Bacteroidetes bacterium HGW-Bacteroidetes-8]
MPESFQLIVLHTIKHKESGIIVQGYSNRAGRETFFLRGGSKKIRGSNLSQLHPLSVIDVTLSSFKLSEIPIIKEFSPALRVNAIRGDLFKSAIALFISELVYKTIKEQEQNNDLYSFLVNSIKILEEIKFGTANFHPYFMIGFCRQIGYSPETTIQGDGMLFDIPSAKYISTTERGEYCFGPDESSLLYRLSATPLQEIASIKSTGNQRYMLIKEMIRYISFHTGFDVKIESLEVLHEVFE